MLNTLRTILISLVKVNLTICLLILMFVTRTVDQKLIKLHKNALETLSAMKCTVSKYGRHKLRVKNKK